MYVFYEVGIISAGFFHKKTASATESLVPAVAVAGSPSGLPMTGKPGEGEYVGVPTGGRQQ